MRIVYTVLSSHVAGGQLVCLQMMDAAREAGHDVCLVTRDRGNFTDIVEARGIAVAVIPMRRTFHLHRAWQFKRFLDRWHADLVHCHDAVPGMILSCLASYVGGVRFIGHVHIRNTFSGIGWKRALQIFAYNRVLRLADAIVAISKSTGHSLVEQGLPPNRVTVIHNGVQIRNDLGEGATNRARARLQLNASQRVVGCVARLCPVKGQRDLLMAAEKVVQVLPDLNLVLVGEDLEFAGEYRRQLNDLARERGLAENVVFAGYQPDAGALMAGFDVFVLPSYTEGLPLTILEAMACALPVVATPVGGVPELVIDGETGLLVPPGDCSELAAAIIDLLTNKEKARQMGRAGRQRVERQFALKDMTAKTLELYQTVARGGQYKRIPMDG